MNLIVTTPSLSGVVRGIRLGSECTDADVLNEVVADAGFGVGVEAVDFQADDLTQAVENRCASVAVFRGFPKKRPSLSLRFPNARCHDQRRRRCAWKPKPSCGLSFSSWWRAGPRRTSRSLRRNGLREDGPVVAGFRQTDIQVAWTPFGETLVLSMSCHHFSITFDDELVVVDIGANNWSWNTSRG